MNLRQPTALAILWVLGSACTDRGSPSAPLLVPTPRMLIVPPSLTDALLPVTSGSDPSYGMPLPTYSDTVLVALRLSDFISMTSKPNTAIQPYNGPLDGAGVFVGGVYSTCYVNVKFTYVVPGATAGFSAAPAPCYQYPQPTSPWVDTLIVAGQGTVTRGPGVPQYQADCDWSECHSYDGFQKVSVTPLPALLQLSATGSRGVQGTTITFTASVTPEKAHNITMPKKILSWEWTPAGGSGQTIACSTPVNPCSVQVQENGSMRVRALANGAEQFISVGVTLITWTPSNACAAPALTYTPRPITKEFGKTGGSHPRPHTGRDYEVPIGVPVYSVDSGRVADKGRGRTAGNFVVIKNQHLYSYYFHLNSIAPGLGVAPFRWTVLDLGIKPQLRSAFRS